MATAHYGYLIADANGIVVPDNPDDPSVGQKPDNPLPKTEVGKVYEIPDVMRSSQTANTFTPSGWRISLATTGRSQYRHCRIGF